MARDDRLMVPLFAGGKLVNVQTITPEGIKRPVFGARKIGAHHVIGEIVPGQPIAFAEGLATAKSFHEPTGMPVVMALDTGNLLPVAEAFRKAHLVERFVFVADNDAHLPKRAGERNLPNVGVEKAYDAALRVANAMVLTAPELAERTAADKGTDWNDVTAAQGREAVQAAARSMIDAHRLVQDHAKQARGKKQAPEQTQGPRQSRGPRLTK
jgi:phage/plasmid primase-like uncharacterized protein